MSSLASRNKRFFAEYSSVRMSECVTHVLAVPEAIAALGVALTVAEKMYARPGPIADLVRGLMRVAIEKAWLRGQYVTSLLSAGL